MTDKSIKLAFIVRNAINIEVKVKYNLIFSLTFY